MSSGAGRADPVDALRRDYRTAFLRYLPSRSEAALTAAYELGRAALIEGRSVLDLVRVHHEVLQEVLAGSTAAEIPAVVDAAGDFLAEVLGSSDMAQRSLLHPERASEPADD